MILYTRVSHFAKYKMKNSYDVRMSSRKVSEIFTRPDIVYIRVTYIIQFHINSYLEVFWIS